MPWTSKYPNAQFAELLVTNLATLVLASEADALSWANGGAMDAFKQPYRKTRWINTVWPNLSFIVQETNPNEAEDESRLDEEHSVVVVIEDIGSDADTAAASVQKRARAIAMIVIGLTSSQLMAGHTKAGSLSRDVSKIDYRDFFNEKQSIYKKTATFTITFSFMETK